MIIGMWVTASTNTTNQKNLQDEFSIKNCKDFTLTKTLSEDEISRIKWNDYGNEIEHRASIVVQAKENKNK